MSDVSGQLPRVFHAVAPDLASLVPPSEPGATCDRCAMAVVPAGADPEDPDGPVVFTHAARCCTYHPLLANHLVGRILRRGGEGAERMRARIATGEGVEALHVRPSAENNDRYRAISGRGFGRSGEIVCPYWVGGPQGCSIWADRNSVCRTWFCKHDDAGRAKRRWNALQQVLAYLEAKVAWTCVAHGSPPPPGAKTHEWVAWYRWCAERADLFGDDDVAEIRDEVLERRLGALRDAWTAAPSLPDVVVPSLGAWYRLETAVLATSYSEYDLDALPPDVFVFFARLDGRPWREALGDGFDEAFVERLWRRGLLAAGGDAFPTEGQVGLRFADGPWAAYPELQESLIGTLGAKEAR